MELTGVSLLLFDQNPMPMWIYRRSDLRILKANRAAMDQYGYSAEEFATLSLKDFHRGEPEAELQSLVESRPGTLRKVGLVRHVRKDGTPLDVEVTTHDLDFEGQPARLALVIDATSRVHAGAVQASLTAERDQLLEDLQLIMDRMPVGCLINNAEDEITYWNPAAEIIFGFRADEVLGLNMDAKIIPAHAKPLVERVRLGMVAGNQNIHSINQNLTKDGRLITCEWENTPLHSPNGRFRGFLAMVRDITEQQQLSQERDRLLERLQLVMESLPVAFMVSDPDLRVSYWNPAAERMFGFSAEEALGQSEYDLIVPPDAVPLVGTNIQSMITQGKEVRALNENVTRDGRRIICEWINTPLVSADGKVQGLIAMAQDITEQRRIAQSLEESERRFRGIFEDTPIPTWFADFSAVKSELQRLARGGAEDIHAHLRRHPAELEAMMASIRILDINAAAVEMHRAASKAELIAHFAHIFMPEAAPALVDTMALIAVGERVFDQETALRTLDGQPLWVMFRWQAALGHEDTADRVLISVVDVSQRKKNDADQARSLGKLQLLTQAAVKINSAPNLDGLLQAVVDWSRQITGAILASASLSENGGENQRIRAFSTDERLKTARLVGMRGKILRRAIFQTLFAGGKAARFSQTDLAAMPMEDAGDARLLTDARIGGYLAVPIISQAGSHLGILLLAHAEDQTFDASDVALATQLGLIAAAALEKQNLLDQLRQAEVRMRELARQVVSAQEKERQQIARELHDETGQNLTALKLSLQLTAEDLPAGAPGEPGEPGLQTQLRESINLVETIMNQTRELARMLRPPRLEALSLGASLEALCIDFSKRLRIPITYRGCALPQLDDLMSLSIYRFVQEGLTNVARHARANSARVSLQCGDQAIQVSIEDDGQGFDRLETKGSAGIGLRGMRERIEMLNGLLRVESRRGQGSRLVAVIPIEAVLLIRVLIADDHNLVRQGIRALLERADDIQVVAEAADGLEALELAFEFRPDVLVLDVGMPNLSGTQTLEHLERASPQTQAVILSMYSDEALVRQALRSGARGYLLKNSIKEELILAVRAAARGEIYLSPAVSNVLVDGFLDQPAESGPLDALTPREREVMKLIAEGQTNAGIARLLHISVKTVEKHRANLLAKLGVRDTAALVRLAVQYRLVFLDDHL